MALSLAEDIMTAIKQYTSDGLNKAGLIVLRSAKQNSPVDTGNLRRSNMMEKSTPGNCEVRIYNNADYAAYVEAGTSKSPAQPFMQPALEQNKTAILDCLTNLF